VVTPDARYNAALIMLSNVLSMCIACVKMPSVCCRICRVLAGHRWFKKSVGKSPVTREQVRCRDQLLWPNLSPQVSPVIAAYTDARFWLRGWQRTVCSSSESAIGMQNWTKDSIRGRRADPDPAALVRQDFLAPARSSSLMTRIESGFRMKTARRRQPAMWRAEIESTATERGRRGCMGTMPHRDNGEMRNSRCQRHANAPLPGWEKQKASHARAGRQKRPERCPRSENIPTGIDIIGAIIWGSSECRVLQI
jgi:hypothetical protein